MIDMNDAERVGVMVDEWQPQRLSAASAAAKLISNEFTDHQLGSLDVAALVDRLVVKFAIPPVAFLNQRSKFIRNGDGRPGGLFLIPLQTSAGVASALRYKGTFYSPVPQLYVLPDWHEHGPAVLFEFTDPTHVEDDDQRVRNNVESLNVTLLIRAQTIQNEISSVVQHFVDEARARMTDDILQQAEADRFYAALPFEEIGGTPRIEETLVEAQEEDEGQRPEKNRNERSARRRGSPGRDKTG